MACNPGGQLQSVQQREDGLPVLLDGSVVLRGEPLRPPDGPAPIRELESV